MNNDNININVEGKELFCKIIKVSQYINCIKYVCIRLETEIQNRHI